MSSPDPHFIADQELLLDAAMLTADRLSRSSLARALVDLDRDIYAETVAATGINPEQYRNRRREP